LSSLVIQSVGERGLCIKTRFSWYFWQFKTCCTKRRGWKDEIVWYNWKYL